MVALRMAICSLHRGFLLDGHAVGDILQGTNACADAQMASDPGAVGLQCFLC